MFCHLSVLIGAFGFFLGPLVCWLLKREEDPFVDEQGKEALNFQITMLIATIVSAILSLILIGLVMLLAVGLMATILPIIAGIKANQGEAYRYPLTLRLVR